MSGRTSSLAWHLPSYFAVTVPAEARAVRVVYEQSDYDRAFNLEMEQAASDLGVTRISIRISIGRLSSGTTPSGDWEERILSIKLVPPFARPSFA